MQNSKLAGILKSMDQREFKKFGQFVESPFFNRLQNVIKLYGVMKKNHPEFSSRNFTEEKIYKQVFGNEKFNKAKMFNLVSDLLSLAEEFISYSGFKKNYFESKINLLEELEERRLSKLFEINYNELKKYMTKEKYRGEEYYNMKFRSSNVLEEHKYFSKDYAVTRNLPQITDNLINYFLIKLLKLYTFTINEEQAYKFENKSLRFLEEIVYHVESNEYENEPLIRIYSLVLLLTLKEKEDYYNELKKLKTKYFSIIPNDELEQIYICLKNYCTKMVLQGKNEYLRDFLELTKEPLDKMKTSGKQGSISNFAFMNAIITSLKLDDVLWAEEFIREFQDFLQPEGKADTVNLSKAMIFFNKKEFEKSLGELMKINFEDSHHKLHLRILNLQNFYELNYSEEADSMVDSYRHFLTRDKTLTPVYKTYHLNFVKNYGLLLNIRLKENYPEAGFLKQRVEKENFPNKEWIIEKLNELQKV